MKRSTSWRLAAAIAVVGILLTAISTWTTATINHNNERRLLQVQTKQVAAVLTAAILLIERPLATALDIERTNGGDPAAFVGHLGPYIGPGKDKLFVSASLWKRTGKSVRRISSVGIAPAMSPRSAATRAFLVHAFSKPTYSVRAARSAAGVRIVYAETSPGSDYVVYAERAIPANRRSPVDKDSAFADLHYAIYLGPRKDDAALTTTDVAPASLPLSGNTYEVAVPFGDTALTLTTSPSRHLGGSFSARLPWIILVGGLLLTLLATRIAQQLDTGRRTAESDAATITDLYERVDALYMGQREISARLQRSLLPQSHPDIPGLEIASDYVAGARGVEIGGDWYSVVALDTDRYAFVVGDVSGSGVDAAALMARVRFTLDAYLSEGHPPEVALEKCSHQFDISTDGHMTTVLVGTGDLARGQVRLASAGHPRPLLLSAGQAQFVPAPVGPPLGVGVNSYTATTTDLPAGSVLVAFTDGLVERRTEDIDAGMDRLAAAAAAAAGDRVDEVVRRLITAMDHSASEDDVAVLALGPTRA
ncbi:MAG: PP2C family protein-serine/threonine phosphatase [Marmoricola sp.]